MLFQLFRQLALQRSDLLLPATLARSGAVTVFSWLIGTLLAVALGGAFARLARQYPDLNSPDDYIRPSLGRDMGFLATTAYWLSSWVGNNAIAVAAVGYLVILLPVGDSASPSTSASSPTGPYSFRATPFLMACPMRCSRASAARS